MKKKRFAQRVFKLVAAFGLALAIMPVAGVESAPGPDPGKVVLFDGKSLAGWKGDPSLWRVENGEIVGTVKDRLARNEFLVSDKKLKDFRLIVDVKLTTVDNNSGIQFRSQPIVENGHTSVKGYQADMGGKNGVYWGHLYHEHGRAWLWQKPGGSNYLSDAGGWNTYEILAMGHHIRTAINGFECVNLEDPEGEDEGVVALQLHAGGPMEVRFRNFRVEVNPGRKLATRAVFEPVRVEKATGLSPREATRAMKVPEGFSVSLVAGEPDVQQPVAFTFDARGRLWVAEAYSYPQRRPDGQGTDKIVIFEDADGDGRFETRKTFAEKLNLVSALEVGFGGVWVGAAPDFLFIPDRNGDDVPDGPAQVLLDGWDFRDTHEALNSFIWGPDGWLYGNHGVFNRSWVGKPGTPKDKRAQISAGVWRYHPTRHEFEVFAHGGSNQWGLDFDEFGQAFITTCRSKNGGGPVTHVIQGGHYWYQSGGGAEYAYAYDPILSSADHGHGRGGAGGPGSDEKYGGHAHAGAMIYLGDSWPDRYRNTLFTHNIHGARINHDIPERAGSGFAVKHAPADFLFANDPWFLGVDLTYGPDGSMFMIDWYDRQRCHHTDVEKWDRTNGRIYKVKYGSTASAKVDLSRLDDRELVKLQLHKNDWYVRMARRLLQERAATRAIVPAARKELLALLAHQDPTRRLRGLWALAVIGDLTDAVAAKMLASNEEYLRAWTIQLLTNRRAGDRALSAGQIQALARLAANDPSPVVRLYIASALQRMPLPSRWPVAEALLSHEADATDHNLPAMIWYGTEPLVMSNLGRAMKVARDGKMPQVSSSIYRRAAIDPRGLEIVVSVLGSKKDPAGQQALLETMANALADRGRVTMPKVWAKTAGPLLASSTAPVRQVAETLSAQFGDKRILPGMRLRLADKTLPKDDRQHAFDLLQLAQDPDLAPTLHALLDDKEFRGSAIRALARFDHQATPALLLQRYPELGAREKAGVVSTLGARPAFALALLDAMAAHKIPVKDLSPFVARQMAKLGDVQVTKKLNEVWGVTRPPSGEKAERVAHFRGLFSENQAWHYSEVKGREVFNRVCAPCHKLFGEGGDIAPELTGSSRTNLDYLLENIIDPSFLIGADFQLTNVQTKDGQALSGIITQQNEKALVLKTINDKITVARTNIAAVETSDVSMMPEGLLDGLADDEYRNLMKYLQAPSQVALAPAGP